MKSSHDTSTRTRPREPGSLALALCISAFLHAGLWAAAMVAGPGGAGGTLGPGLGEGGAGDGEYPMFSIKLHEPRGTQASVVSSAEFAAAPSAMQDEIPDAPLIDALAALVDVSKAERAEVSITPPDDVIEVAAIEAAPAPVVLSVSGPPIATEPDARDGGASRVESDVEDPAALALAGGGLARARSHTSGTESGAAGARGASGDPSGTGSGTSGGGGDGGGSGGGGGAGDESGSGTSDAALVYSPHPEYPSLSIRRREEGRVVCLMHVDVEGRVGRVEVSQSSGYPRLDRAAVDTLTRWRFRPAMRGGRRAPFTFSHTVRFVLQ